MMIREGAGYAAEKEINLVLAKGLFILGNDPSLVHRWVGELGGSWSRIQLEMRRYSEQYSDQYHILLG